MNHLLRLILNSVGVLAASGILSGLALAQGTFELSDITVAPQAAEMSGGDFAMASAMVGEGMIEASGGEFSLEAFITPVTSSVEIGDTAVSIAIEGNDLVLTWPQGAAGFVMEATATLGPGANWQPVLPVPSEGRYTTPLTQTSRFFRLRRQ